MTRHTCLEAISRELGAIGRLWVPLERLCVDISRSHVVFREQIPPLASLSLVGKSSIHLLCVVQPSKACLLLDTIEPSSLEVPLTRPLKVGGFSQDARALQ